MSKFGIHPSNVLYAAICLAGVMVFFFVGIYSNMTAIRQVDEEIVSLNYKVESQGLLHPVYKRLIKDVQKTIPDKLPLPDRKKIALNDLGHINETFTRIAKTNDVVLESVVPDASSYLDEGENLSLNLSFTGDFFDFQHLLFDICRLPYLDSIEQIRIDTGKANKRLLLQLIIAKE